MQSHSPALPSNSSQDAEQRAMLKEELLQGRNTPKLTRTSSAPDLTWTGEGSMLESSYETSGKLTHSESPLPVSTDEGMQASVRPSRPPNAYTFTSSGDSGFEKDRYSSQDEDFDHAGVHFGSGDTQSLHSRRISGEGEQVKHGDVAHGELAETGNELEGHFEGKDKDTDDLNNNSKDSSTSTEEQCLTVDSSSDKNESISCDTSPDCLSSSVVEKQVDIPINQPGTVRTGAINETDDSKQTINNADMKQDIDTQSVDVEFDTKHETNSTTDKFQSIPTSERSLSWLDRELLRNGRSPVHDGDIIVSRIEDDSSTVSPLSKMESVMPPDKGTDQKFASDIVDTTLSQPKAAHSGNSVECQTDAVSTDTLVAAKEVKLHSHMTDSVLETIPEYADEQSETRTESTNESSTTSSLLQTDMKTEPFKESPLLRHVASDLGLYLPSSEEKSSLNNQFLHSPAVRPKYPTLRHSLPSHHLMAIDNAADEQTVQPTTSGLCVSPSSHSTPVQQMRIHSTTTIQSLEDSITASLSGLSNPSENEDHPYLDVSCSIVDVLVMVQQMVSFVSELCLILCPMPGSVTLEDLDINDIEPSGEQSYSAVLCRDRAKRMRGELLNSITQVRL